MELDKETYDELNNLFKFDFNPVQKYKTPDAEREGVFSIKIKPGVSEKCEEEKRRITAKVENCITAKTSFVFRLFFASYSRARYGFPRPMAEMTF